MKRLSGRFTCAVIKLEVKGKAQFFAAIDAWEREVEAEIERLARGLATEALYTVLYNSAQYSGDFAANWKVAVNRIDASAEDMIFGKSWGDPDPFILGDQPAISYALNRAAGNMSGFKLGDTIWIANSSQHTEHYAWKIEGNTLKFRAGNHGEPIRITVDEFKVKYASIRKDVANRLMGASL